MSGEFPREGRLDGALSASENMAVDKAFYEEIVAFPEEPRAVFRVYEWKNPSISLGASQKEDILNKDLIEKDGVEVVRRITGGRAVYHAGEITYSVCASRSHALYGEGLYDSYKRIALALLKFLEELGLKPDFSRSKIDGASPHQNCFSSPSMYEISLEGKKIIGSAQKRGRDGFLQHGSLPLYVRQDALNRYLLLPSEVDAKPLYASLSDFLPSFDKDDLKKRLLKRLILLS